MNINASLQEDLKEVEKISNQEAASQKGEVHHRRLQGYTIKSMVHLIETIEKLDKQNQKLEERNIGLQSKMLVLTYVMGAVAIITFFSEILVPTLRFFFH